MSYENMRLLVGFIQMELALSLGNKTKAETMIVLQKPKQKPPPGQMLC